MSGKHPAVGGFCSYSGHMMSLAPPPATAPISGATIGPGVMFPILRGLPRQAAVGVFHSTPLTEANVLKVTLPSGVVPMYGLVHRDEFGAYDSDRKLVWSGPLPKGTVAVSFTPEDAKPGDTVIDAVSDAPGPRWMWGADSAT